MQIYSPGTRIGQYEIASRPMMGGMGIVYFCINRENDLPVALKTFRPEFLSKKSERNRFLHEGSIWVELGTHPHIVRCYEVTNPGSSLETFLVLELIAVEEHRKDASLRSWLTPGKPVSVEQALCFAIQIVRGMKHAVDSINGFIHCDLKPENLLVGADKLSNWNVNRVRVTDFGLAAFSGNRYGVAGTPTYMAPEQWKGETLGIYTDIYAVGCILVEMLSGKRPVKGEGFNELRSEHCNGKIQKLPKHLPQSVEDIVQKCIKVDPRHRYQSWTHFDQDLQEAFQKIVGMKVPDAITENKIANENKSAEGWSYKNIGISYLRIGNLDFGGKYCEKAIHIGRELDEKVLEAEALQALGAILVDAGDFSQAVKYQERSLELNRSLNDLSGQAYALGNLGNAYLQQGELQNAIEYFQQSLSITRMIDDKQSEINCLGSLASAFFMKNEYRQAIDLLHKAVLLARDIHDQISESVCLEKLGNCYSQLGEHQRGIEYLKQALSIAEEIANPMSISTTLANLGAAYGQINDIETSLEYFNKARLIKDDIGDKLGEATVLFNMAILYNQQGDVDHSLPLAMKAKSIFTQIGHIEYVNQVQNLIEHLQREEKGSDRENEITWEVLNDAFQAFQAAISPDEMFQATQRYPFMIDLQFFALVEKTIQEKIPPNKMYLYQERLTWLKQIAHE